MRSSIKQQPTAGIRPKDERRVFDRIGLNLAVQHREIQVNDAQA
jgi:hypothetical protein